MPVQSLPVAASDMSAERWAVALVAVVALTALRARGLSLRPVRARLSLADWNAYDERDINGPGTYSFGYDIEDPVSGNSQFRQEERLANGTVTGSYGLLEPDGSVRIVTYVADALGYRVRIQKVAQRRQPARRSFRKRM